MIRLDRTAAALAVYDAGDSARLDAVLSSRSEEELASALKAEGEAEDLVREAFAADTADVNPRGRAFLVHPDDPWLRRTVARHSSVSAPGSPPSPSR